MLKCGTSCWNDTVLQISNNNLPFGGVGSSGMGHYHGKFGFETFSHLCSVLKSHRDIKLMYPPFNSKKVKLFKKLLKN
jgi:aldehyde dehydrogenase (NAD+)